jgi:hypothetical protein
VLTSTCLQSPVVVAAMRRLLSLLWRCITAPSSQAPITAQEVADELASTVQELEAAEQRAGEPLRLVLCNQLFPLTDEGMDALFEAQWSATAGCGVKLGDMWGREPVPLTPPSMYPVACSAADAPAKADGAGASPAPQDSSSAATLAASVIAVTAAAPAICASATSSAQPPPTAAGGVTSFAFPLPVLPTTTAHADTGTPRMLATRPHPPSHHSREGAPSCTPCFPSPQEGCASPAAACGPPPLPWGALGDGYVSIQLTPSKQAVGTLPHEKLMTAPASLGLHSLFLHPESCSPSSPATACTAGGASMAGSGECVQGGSTADAVACQLGQAGSGAGLPCCCCGSALSHDQTSCMSRYAAMTKQALQTHSSSASAAETPAAAPLAEKHASATNRVSEQGEQQGGRVEAPATRRASVTQLHGSAAGLDADRASGRTAGCGDEGEPEGDVEWGACAPTCPHVTSAPAPASSVGSHHSVHVQQKPSTRGSSVQARIAGAVRRTVCTTFQSMARAALGLLRASFHVPTQHDNAPLLQVRIRW